MNLKPFHQTNVTQRISLDEEYEENEYEIQAFMAGGKEERQKRADGRAARRRREE